MKVVREELKMQKEAGIFGKNKATFRYRIGVQNLKKDSETVNIFDQMPVSQTESIKVKLTESSPQPGEKKDDGILKWVLIMQPSEKREITFQFEVEYPREGGIEGL